ncbi:energy transducer TonB [Helicobacter sp. faydin-H20]|uniref:energy transducer TonB n=1 Tax=Helicobacter anatolicus TaxID=2905874 RepID=UPI001E5BBCE3|nr:energy transducer TonB [Helicobacter anatolicus]MCE3036537.1 energy transducer TonB [Helicobacter anatolicus]
MKILQFLQEKIKQPNTIGFICAGAIYLTIFLAFFDFNSSKVISVQENGDYTITMKVASVNSGGNQTNFSKAPPKQEIPKPKKKKHKKKPQKKPKKQEVMPKETPKEMPKEEISKTNPQESDDKQKASNVTQEGANAETLAYNQGISDDFLSKIRIAISNNNPYPRIARIRGLEGEVTVEFILNIDGSLEGLKILQSTAGEILNKTALKAVDTASKYFPTPKQKVRIKVPIIYSLARG